MKNSYSKKELCILLFAFFVIIGNNYSQNGSFANTYIASGTELAVNNIEYNFANGAVGVLGGVVGTERDATSFLSFVGTSYYVSSGVNGYVDGYVRTYKTEKFIFPIGDNGIYRPVAVSRASIASPSDAAYYGVGSDIAVTSSLKGGDETILPVGGVFKTSSFDNNTIVKVHDKEYWDINGLVSSRITLSWGSESKIAELVDSELRYLTIVGWDGNKWIEIPSILDKVSILGVDSTLDSGSISTTSQLVPNTYNVYTLAFRSCTTPITINSTVCNGSTYSVDFTSDGVVTSNLGKVEGNKVIGVPSGENVTLKSTSSYVKCDIPPSSITVVAPESCDFEIKVFNGLTPDDANGNNAFLYIKGIERYPENSVQIYNRWGVLVYDKKGYNNTDGVFRGVSEGRVTLISNKGLTEGTYFYVINYKDLNSNNKEKSGYLYINR